MDDWFVSEGKDSLLIPEQTPVLQAICLFSICCLSPFPFNIFLFFYFFIKVMDSSMLNRCPHRSEVQSIALAETDSE